MVARVAPCRSRLFFGGGAFCAPQQQEEGFLAYVVLRDGEDGEGLLKRFQSSIQRGGIMRELRNRRFFRTKGEQSRIDKARARRRARRRRRRR